MDDDKELSLDGMTAEDFYESQLSGRTAPVNLARRLADIIIPSVFPPEDWQSGEELAITNQSVNSGCINTLAAKLMLGALPPGLPMAKYTPREMSLKEDIKRDPEMWNEIEYALSRRLDVHQARMESTTVRTSYTQTMKLLLVAGNGLVVWKDIDRPVIHNMHDYVVKRSSGGEALVTVLKECISWAAADEDVQDAARRNRQSKDRPEGQALYDEDIAVFHVEKLIRDGDKKEWHYWQEIEGGEVVEDSEAFSPYDVPIMYPAGMIPTGGNWYLPYASDYEGDHQAVENFAAASQDMAAAAGWNLYFVDPAGQTNIRDVQNADNLETIPGRAGDVTTLENRKSGDYQVVAAEYSEARRRLGVVYMQASALQRSGERVTAEEWQQLVADLDEAMGGLYSLLAQTVQRYFVLRFIHLHELSDKSLGKLPEGLVEVGVVTGIDAIGQNSEGRKLREAAIEAKEVLGEQALAKHLIVSGYLTRLFANKSIKSEGLVKDSKTVQQEDQAAMAAQQQQTLLERGTAPMAAEGAKVIGDMVRSNAPGAMNEQQ